MNIRLKYTHNNRVPITFLYKPTYRLSLIKEEADNGTSYIPRFTLKHSDIFDDIPVNEPIKPSTDIILRCIEYGMIINIDYKGAEDARLEGHNRTIYPMAIGLSKDGKILIRGYHLKGWSISGRGVIEKEWRLFRFDRIHNITFMGAFYRLPPDGYNTTGDKSMTKLIKNANFSEIRKNQEQLIKSQEIDLQDRVVISKVDKVKVKDLNNVVDVTNPFKSNVIKASDANKNYVTFATPVVTTNVSTSIIIIGINIVEGKTFKLYDGKRYIDTYKSIKILMANQIADEKSLRDIKEFDAYLFVEAN